MFEHAVMWLGPASTLLSCSDDLPAVSAVMVTVMLRRTIANITMRYARLCDPKGRGFSLAAGLEGPGQGNIGTKPDLSPHHTYSGHNFDAIIGGRNAQEYFVSCIARAMQFSDGW